MKKSEILFGLLRIPIDIVMTFAAFVTAYHLRKVTNLIPRVTLDLNIEVFAPMNEYLAFVTGAAILLFIIFAINGMYSLKSSEKKSKEIGKVVVLLSIWILFLVAYFFILREYPFSRLVLGYAWLLSILYISIGRILIRAIEFSMLKVGYGRRRLVFVGHNRVTEELAYFFSRDPRYSIVGVIDEYSPGQSQMAYFGSIENLQSIIKNTIFDIIKKKKRLSSSFLEHIGQIHELGDIIKNKQVEEIIQTKSDLTKADSNDILKFCRANHIQYHFVPDLVQVQRTNIDMASPSGIPLISLKPTPLEGWGKVMKRFFDIIGSIIGIFMFALTFIVTAIAIKLDSKGNIFFKYLDNGERVKRVGVHGKLFNFYKFRSMHPNTHNLRYTELADNNTRKGTPMVKIKNDPRVTRVGKFIRKWSIDELPQLWNVLKGDMSLVGPRPHLPEEVANYQHHHKFVLALKPGITGLAQIAGRSDLDFEKEIQLDTYYIENWSLWLDIKIIFKTFKVVFTGKAAHDV